MLLIRATSLPTILIVLITCVVGIVKVRRVPTQRSMAALTIDKCHSGDLVRVIVMLVLVPSFNEFLLCFLEAERTD